MDKKKPVVKTVVKQETFKMFNVTFGSYQYFTVAKSENEAVSKVCKKEHLEHLPFKAELVNLDGYKLIKG